jgi:hypothetical protein
MCLVVSLLLLTTPGLSSLAHTLISGCDTSVNYLNSRISLVSRSDVCDRREHTAGEPDAYET